MERILAELDKTVGKAKMSLSTHAYMLLFCTVGRHGVYLRLPRGHENASHQDIGGAY